MNHVASAIDRRSIDPDLLRIKRGQSTRRFLSNGRTRARAQEPGMFIKIFVSFPTGQHAILSWAHDKRVAGSHGIEPHDRKVPLGCFTSDHSTPKPEACRVSSRGVPGSLVPGFLFPSRISLLRPIQTYIRRLNQRGRNQPTIYTSNSSSRSLPRFHLRLIQLLLTTPVETTNLSRPADAPII